MKLYIGQTKTKLLTCTLLIVVVSFSLSCRKESPLEISDEDTNYFVIRDNPNDPIDHAIYQFYERTGIASYYTDTIHKKLVSKAGEVPERYAYVTVSLNYHPMGANKMVITKLSSKSPIPALLDLMEEQIIPNIPSRSVIPSIVFIDRFTDFWVYVNAPVLDGMTAIRGFNTVGIVVKDVAAMSDTDKKKYAASLLAGLAEKTLVFNHSDILQRDFLGVTHKAWGAPPRVPLYSGFPFMLFTTPATVPPAVNIGLLYYPVVDFSGMQLPAMHSETTDLRSFLAALFYYTEQEFRELYAANPLVLQKYGVVRELTRKAGFKIPE